MAISSSEILESTPATSGQTRLVFRHVADDGTIFGPWIEHRPDDEDRETWLTGNALALTNSLATRETDANLAEIMEES